MIKLENYSFKKKASVGKYRNYIEHFLASEESVMAWKCSDKSELHRVVQGFYSVIKKRNLEEVVRVKQSMKDCVVGLERVEHD